MMLEDADLAILEIQPQRTEFERALIDEVRKLRELNAKYRADLHVWNRNEHLRAREEGVEE